MFFLNFFFVFTGHFSQTAASDLRQTVHAHAYQNLELTWACR